MNEYWNDLRQYILLIYRPTKKWKELHKRKCFKRTLNLEDLLAGRNTASPHFNFDRNMFRCNHPPKDGYRTAGLFYTAHYLSKVRIILAMLWFISKKTEADIQTLLQLPNCKLMLEVFGAWCVVRGRGANKFIIVRGGQWLD